MKIIASKAGVVIRTGVNVEAIEGDAHVSGVRLKTGEVVEAGMVIVSAGIRANIELAKKMGLETKKGVVVNERMETSVSGIYACGDCAQSVSYTHLDVYKRQTYHRGPVRPGT